MTMDQRSNAGGGGLSMQDAPRFQVALARLTSRSAPVGFVSASNDLTAAHLQFAEM